MPGSVTMATSVDEVDVDLDGIAGRGSTHDGADALRGAATTADDPAEIAGADLDLQLDPATGLGGLDQHGVGVVDDRADEMGENRGGGGRRHLVGVVLGHGITSRRERP